MADDPAALRRLGRQVAEQQGYDPNDPSIDFARYGKDAQYRIGKGQSVSPVDKFRIGHQQVRVPGHAQPRRSPRAVAVEGPPDRETERRVVRIGGFEIARDERFRAANRPQHKTRNSERTTGRYRVTLEEQLRNLGAYADPGFQMDARPRYLIDTPRHIRAAWAYINQAKNARRYSANQRRIIHRRIQAAGARFGIEFGHARTRTRFYADADGNEHRMYDRAYMAEVYRTNTMLRPALRVKRWTGDRDSMSASTIVYAVVRADNAVDAKAKARRLPGIAAALAGHARARGGNHSHPAHPYSHPIATKHRRR